MKTPLVYPGGKQSLAPWLSQFIPKHKSYIEPFAGGLALFFGRPSTRKIMEVVNDSNSMIYNFWKQLKDNPDLEKEIQSTLRIREDFEKCQDIFRGRKDATDLEKARATYVVFTFSLSLNSETWVTRRHHLQDDTPWAKRQTNKKRVKKFSGCNFLSLYENKAKSIPFIKKRLKDTLVENMDALKLIPKYDWEEAFFYCDPPYPETNQAHYSGYTMEDFNKLCRLLKTIKGRFMLSCYLRDGMEIDKNWKIRKKEVICKGTITLNKAKPKRIETIVMNY